MIKLGFYRSVHCGVIFRLNGIVSALFGVCPVLDGGLAGRHGYWA